MVSNKRKVRGRIKKSAPPSRIKYEQANPAVTVRLPRELRDQLAELRDKHGLTLGDVLRIGLERAQPDLEGTYRRGYLDAFGKCVTIALDCRHCWDPMCELFPDDA